MYNIHFDQFQNYLKYPRFFGEFRKLLRVLGKFDRNNAISMQKMLIQC